MTQDIIVHEEITSSIIRFNLFLCFYDVFKNNRNSAILKTLTMCAVGSEKSTEHPFKYGRLSVTVSILLKEHVLVNAKTRAEQTCHTVTF